MHNLKKLLDSKEATIGVIGLGYVGLPLAVAFARAEFRVIGFDRMADRVASVNRGESYIADVTSEELKELTGPTSGTLMATTNTDLLKDCDAICVCVPTPIKKNRSPDLSHIVSVTDVLAQTARYGQLFILESTTYPGTTREVMLHQLETTGLKHGTDFYLAFSPERVDPNSKDFNITNTPKVVGGIDEEATNIACLLYSHVAESVVPVSSPEVAEMTKLFENVFRSVNIALVNELAQLCDHMKVSVWDVINAASTKPFGFMKFQPGPGVGGHCIPLDPYYLSTKAREFDFHTRFIELSASINEHMPYYVTHRIMEALNQRCQTIRNAGILVLGVAYKKDVGDDRESPALKTIELLLRKGALVVYHDPFIPSIEVQGRKMESVPLDDEHLQAADCVLIATDHSVFDYQHILNTARLVFDSRGATLNIKSDKLIRLGESGISEGNCFKYDE